jgi:hypothetical protein
MELPYKYKCNKGCYPSKKEAKSKLNFLITTWQWNKKEKGRTYYCAQCNAWHLTHKEWEAKEVTQTTLKYQKEFEKFIHKE